MGVYLFHHRTAPFIKVGSYVCRGKRTLDNPWYRIANRGYHSIKHPAELSGADLDADAFELLAWFPNLQRKHETLVHKHFADRIGEFHAAVHKKELIAYCEHLGGIAENVSAEAKAAAWRWAHRSDGFNNASKPLEDKRETAIKPTSSLCQSPTIYKNAKNASKRKRKLTTISPT